MRMRHLLMTAIAGSLALSGAAQAASVNQFVNFDGATVNEADDANYEYLAVDGDADGFLDVGDVIRGAVNFDTVNGTNVATGGVQWTAVFSLRVDALVNVSDPDAVANSGDETADIVFGPDAGFGAYLASLSAAYGAPTDGPAVGAGTLLRFWENDTFTADPFGTTDPDENIATFATGDFYWDLGFLDPSAASHDDAGTIVSDNGEGWVARDGGLEFTAGAGFGPDNVIGRGDVALNRTAGGSNGSYGLIPQLLGALKIAQLGASAGDSAEFLGFSTVEGADGQAEDAGFDATSSSELTFIAIPTPAAVGPGLALLGLIGLRRQRRQVA